MPDLQPPPAEGGTLNADLRGVHYDVLKERVPAWFSQAPASRQAELGNYELHLPSWYRRATPQQHAALSSAHRHFRQALNQLENRLGNLNDIFEFAEQPLKDAIKSRFGLDVDVRNVYFARKYAFKDRDLNTRKATKCSKWEIVMESLRPVYIGKMTDRAVIRLNSQFERCYRRLKRCHSISECLNRFIVSELNISDSCSVLAIDREVLNA